MKNLIFKSVLSTVSIFSMLMVLTSVSFAAPVRFEQVQQVVNAKPGKANAGGFTQLRLADESSVTTPNDGGDSETQQDDERKIITKTTEILEDTENCNCLQEPEPKGKFPRWAILGLAAAGAVPVALVLLRKDKENPTPSPGVTVTPTTTQTTTPTVTPPPPTPNEPVPEPMTLLLFGTGLAGIGLAARRGFRRREDDEKAE